MSNERVDQDGKPAIDLLENPKAVERKKREEAARDALIEERKQPWSRERIERELVRIAVINRTGGRVKEAMDLHGVDLSGLDLSGLDLSRSNMHGASLVGTNLSGCRMVNVNLHGAELRDAVLEGTYAVDSNLHGACVCAARFSKSTLLGVNLQDACCEDAQDFPLQEVDLTPAEERLALQADVDSTMKEVLADQGKVRYVGDALRGANITGLSQVCRRRGK